MARWNPDWIIGRMNDLVALLLKRRGRISLFDDVVRSNRKGATHSESHFAFLNRVESRFFGNVRTVLDRWFRHFPREGQGDLRSRFRSDDDRQMLGAFWELYLHEALRRLRWRVTPHPSVPNTTRQPDFLATRRKEAMYVEATVVSQSDTAVAADRRLSQALDALNRLETTDFMLRLSVMAQGPNPPRISGLRSELKSWLDELDASQVEADYRRGGWMELPTRKWERDGWSIVFQALPKSADRRGVPTGRPIGVWGPGKAYVVDQVTPLRTQLEDKAGRYGHLEAPYLIAALIQEKFGPEDYEADEVLFGTRTIEFDSSTGDATPGRRADGVWIGAAGPRNQGVSGVLVAARLVPWTIAKVEPTLWLNPWASWPLSFTFPWRTRDVDLVAGKFRTSELKKRAHHLFGLPKDWPGPEDLEL